MGYVRFLGGLSFTGVGCCKNVAHNDLAYIHCLDLAW